MGGFSFCYFSKILNNGSMKMDKIHPVVLIIRDGWGINHQPKEAKWDATKRIPTPTTDELEAHWPHTEIEASGLDVGLPDGIMGNSEVGHQNIGAGRIVDQEIVRIDKAFECGEVLSSPILKSMVEFLKKSGGKLHLLGLLSNGGVHSIMRHAENLVKVTQKLGVKRIYLHAFMDGRDTPPTSGIQYIKEWEHFAAETHTAQIASVSGRFWAMDRDNRWDRIEKAYQCLTGGSAQTAHSASEAVERYYQSPLSDTQKGDEFILPTQILNSNGTFEGKIEDGDAIIFFNFRGDRPREITRAFTEKNFQEFSRPQLLNLFYVTMTEYQKNLCPHVLFPKAAPMKNILGEYISSLGLKQFRTAETEKYAHVTFFFNDYREAPFSGEERRLIPSPKEVSTYDEKPQMSAEAVCESITKAIQSQKFALMVVNFANPDMVGHTGNFEATKCAIQTVDRCLGKILKIADCSSTQLVITADHGNAENMWDFDNNVPHTQHTTNPVEVILYGSRCKNLNLRSGGRLADIAPTILQIMGLPQPQEMTGKSLIVDR